jgi:hypothetical protein
MKTCSFIHFWPDFEKDNINNNWLKDNFFKYYEYTDDYINADIVIINCFGDIRSTIEKIKGKKLFFITEPIYNKYIDLINNNTFDLIFGCIDENNINNRFKYPLGLIFMNFFDRNNLKQLNETNLYVKTCDLGKKTCCLVNSHDVENTRTPAYNIFKKYEIPVVCPGKLYNNCSNDELNSIGKVEYSKLFLFSICSENTLSLPGYITEKPMECCLGGAIPIYAGNFDDIDAKIYNKKRFLFYDSYDENSIIELEKKIINFMHNWNEFEEFYRQEVFLDTAEETIVEFKNRLDNKIHEFYGEEEILDTAEETIAELESESELDDKTN